MPSVKYTKVLLFPYSYAPIILGSLSDSSAGDILVLVSVCLCCLCFVFGLSTTLFWLLVVPGIKPGTFHIQVPCTIPKYLPGPLVLFLSWFKVTFTFLPYFRDSPRDHLPYSQRWDIRALSGSDTALCWFLWVLLSATLHSMDSCKRFSPRLHCCGMTMFWSHSPWVCFPINSNLKK